MRVSSGNEVSGTVPFPEGSRNRASPAVGAPRAVVGAKRACRTQILLFRSIQPAATLLSNTLRTRALACRGTPTVRAATRASSTIAATSSAFFPSLQSRRPVRAAPRRALFLSARASRARLISRRADLGAVLPSAALSGTPSAARPSSGITMMPLPAATRSTQRSRPTATTSSARSTRCKAPCTRATRASATPGARRPT